MALDPADPHSSSIPEYSLYTLRWWISLRLIDTCQQFTMPGKQLKTKHFHTRKMSFHARLSANQSRADGADFLDRILLARHRSL